MLECHVKDGGVVPRRRNDLHLVGRSLQCRLSRVSRLADLHRVQQWRRYITSAGDTHSRNVYKKLARNRAAFYLVFLVQASWTCVVPIRCNSIKSSSATALSLWPRWLQASGSVKTHSTCFCLCRLSTKYFFWVTLNNASDERTLLDPNPSPLVR